MQVIIANPRGFCAGVDRAIHIVEHALLHFGAPIYVRHEIVHNRFVVDDLKQRGVVFVDKLNDIPRGAVVIFSAHGVAKSVYDEAAERKLHVIDATCPLVTKVHHKVDKYCNADYEIIVIGHPRHVEILGTIGQLNVDNLWRIHVVETENDVQWVKVKDPNKLAYVTQTTLSVDDTKQIIDALKQRFPNIVAPVKEDICYATQNRQEAVKSLATQCDVILVVGSKTSSNSNSLKELAIKKGVPAYLIDGPEDIQSNWLKNKNCVGLTAGASAPEVLIKKVLAHLKDAGATQVHEMHSYPENIYFRLPKIVAPHKQQANTLKRAQ